MTLNITVIMCILYIYTIRGDLAYEKTEEWYAMNYRRRSAFEPAETERRGTIFICNNIL